MKKIFLKIGLPITLLIASVFIIGPACSAPNPDPNQPEIYKFAIAKLGDSCGAGIKSNGTLWTWGGNNLGTLGNNSMTDSNKPIQVGTETDWKTLEAGQAHIIALKNNGTLWGWGDNFQGQLGIGTTTASGVRIPTQIGTDSDWKTISSTYNHTLAIKTNGTLWAWGRNDYTGQLGDGTIINKLSPVQIGTATNWSSISAGDHHSMAIKTDGTLWTWGNNDEGQFGTNNTSGSLIPLNISATAAGIITYKFVSCGAFHTLAIRTDGTLWATGINTDGQIGDGTNTNRTSFVKIGTSADWIFVSAGLAHNIGLKGPDNVSKKLVVWGKNHKGQLGDGTTISRNSPISLPFNASAVSAKNWTYASVHSNHTIGRLVEDSELFSWGENPLGQLGIGTNTDVLEPTRVIIN